MAVRQQHEYYLKGWKQQRIYPDFVAMTRTDKTHLLIIETKGKHLEGNPDTDYKRRVFCALEKVFNAGQMTVREGPAKGVFKLLFDESEFSKALAGLQDT